MYNGAYMPASLHPLPTGLNAPQAFMSETICIKYGGFLAVRPIPIEEGQSGPFRRKQRRPIHLTVVSGLINQVWGFWACLGIWVSAYHGTYLDFKVILKDREYVQYSLSHRQN
jgi:hypothetical protein